MKKSMMTLLSGLLALTLNQACHQQTAQAPASGSEKVADYLGELPAEWYQAPAEIKLNGAEGVPSVVRNFYFIFDGSDSMTEATDSQCGGDQKFRNKISGAVWALEQFMSSLPEDVKIGLFVFDREGRREVVPLGLGNRDAFLRAIQHVRPGYNTPLAEAIRFGTAQLVKEYKKQLGYGEFRLVVITDGEAKEIPEAAIFAAQRGIPIYTIGLCVAPNHPLRRFSVSYRAADNFADLASGLSGTLAELPNYDATEFESSN